MAREHGITAATPYNFLLDSGAVYLDYGLATETLLGATRGGNNFVVEQEIREMPLDGARGRTVGGNRIIRVTPKITANFVEINPDVMALALPGVTSDTSTTPGYTIYSRAIQLAVAAYKTNIAIVGEYSGSTDPMICMIYNGLATGNMELNFQDQDEAVVAVEFTGHFALDDLDTEPWKIWHPGDDVTTTTP